MARGFLRLGLAVLLAAACALPLSRVPTKSLEGWHTVETGGVRVVGEASAEELHGLASELAGFDAGFAHLIGKRIPPARGTTIFLFRSERLAGQFALGRGTHGWALHSADGAYASVLLSSNRVETGFTLFHEYTHLLLARFRQARLPRWYNEGLAVYFSTLGMRDGALVAGTVPTGRIEWLAARGPMPLERLFGVGRGWTFEEAMDFYATSWALTHYLLGSPDGRRELARFEAALARGTPLDAAREHAFGRSLAALDAELTTHVGYLLRSVSAEVVLDPGQLRIAEPPPPAPLAPGAVARELGLLALTLGDQSDEDRSLRLAARLLRTALHADPANARTRAALAHAEALLGDAERATATLEGALRSAPDDPEVRLRAGRVALEAGQFDRARTHFEHVLASDDASAPGWLGLGLAHAGADRTDAALEALGRARALRWSDSIDLELGRLHLAAGRRDEAVALLHPLAQDTHRGPAGDRAAELLEEEGLSGGVDDGNP